MRLYPALKKVSSTFRTPASLAQEVGFDTDHEVDGQRTRRAARENPETTLEFGISVSSYLS